MLEIKINYLLVKYMFVVRAASFIYRDEGSEPANLFSREWIVSMRLISKVIIVSTRRFSAAADFALHCVMSERRWARR